MAIGFVSPKFLFLGVLFGALASAVSIGSTSLNNHLNRTVYEELKSSKFRFSNSPSDWNSSAMNYWKSTAGSGKDASFLELNSKDPQIPFHEKLKNRCTSLFLSKNKSLDRNTFDQVKKYCRKTRSFRERSKLFTEEWKNEEPSKVIGYLYGNSSSTLASRHHNKDSFWSKEYVNFLMGYCSSLALKLPENKSLENPTPSIPDTTPPFKQYYYDKYCQE